MICRSAACSDLQIIHSLIRESKGFGRYSDAFLDDLMEQWGIKENYIHSNDLILFEKGDELIGLYAFKINNDNALNWTYFLSVTITLEKE